MIAVIGWLLVIALFAIGMLGAIYPVLPGALAIFGAFIVYGLFFSFEPFGFWFWTIQVLIVLTIFIADYAVGAWGVKKFGGSRASVIGSAIGILIGPFVMPLVGLVLGPFLGAVIGELTVSREPKHLMKVGVGSVIGLFSSVVVKFVLQLVMIISFALWLR